MPATRESIIRDVEFNEEFDPSIFELDTQLDFLTTVPEAAIGAGGIVTVLGFGSFFNQKGTMNTDDIVRPIVDFKEVPERFRTTGSLGKGIGFRLYNAPQGPFGLAERPVPPRIYAYTVDLPTDRILNKVPSEGSVPARLWQHARRIGRARTPMLGLENMVAKVHEGYGDAAAVEMSQPPRAHIRQAWEQGHPNPRGLRPKYMLIRDGNLVLRRVGVYDPHPKEWGNIALLV